MAITGEDEPTRHRQGAPLIILGKDDSIETVLNAMKSFPNDTEILDQALDQLSLKCQEVDPDMSWSSLLPFAATTDSPRARLLSLGAVPLVLAALQNHPSLREKAEQATLDLLINPADGVARTFETMKKYPTLFFLQERGCQVLSDLMRSGDDYMARSELRECGAIEALLELFNDPDTPPSTKASTIDVLGIASVNATNCSRLRKHLSGLIATWLDESCTVEMHIGVCSVLGNMARTSTCNESKAMIVELGGIAALVASLERFPDESAVAQSSLALAYVCRNNKESVELLVESAIMSTIVRLLGSHPSKCVGPVLQLLASEEGTSIAFANGGGIDALLEAGRQHPDSVSDISTVFFTLILLTKNSGLGGRLRTPETIKAGYDAMQKYPSMDAPRVFLFSIGEDVQMETIMTAPAGTGPTVAVSVENAPEPSSLIYAANHFAIASSGTDVGSHEPDQTVQMIPSISFWQTTGNIIKQMSEFPFDVTVQEQACLQLSNRCVFGWALLHGSAEAKNIATTGGIELLVSAMRNHIDSLNIQKSACGLLGYIAKSGDTRELIIQAGGADAAQASMKAHTDDSDLHAYALALVSELLEPDTPGAETVAENVISAAGVQLLVQSMIRHHACSGVQAHACTVIAGLAYYSPTRQQLIAEAGGIQAVINALKMHINDETVREKSCAAINNLATGNEDNQKLIVSLGGVGLLVLAVTETAKNAKTKTQGVAVAALTNVAHHYPGGTGGEWEEAIETLVDGLLNGTQFDSKLQSAVCSALCCLYKKNENCRQFAVQTKAGRAILVAMKRNKHSLIFQERAVEALLPISESAEGWRQLWQYNGVAVLVSAIKDYPESEHLHHEAIKLLLKLSDARFAIAESGAVELAKQARTKFPSVSIFGEFLHDFGVEIETSESPETLVDVELGG